MQVDDAWRWHRRWAALAGRRLRELVRFRRANIGLLVLGAVLGATSAQAGRLGLSWSAVPGAIGATALAAAAFIQGRWLTPERVQERVLARSASESVKAAVIQRLAGVGPFAGAGGDAHLEQAVRDVAQRTDSLVAAVTVIEPDDAALPDIHGVQDYVDKRAREQATWHVRAARKRLRLERRWRTAEVLATLTAAVLSAVGVAVKFQDLAIWVGVATTIATALAAHLAREQHAQIAAGYARTANDLDRLVRQFDVATADDATAAAFIADVEQLLVTHGTSWAAQTTSAR